MKKLSRLTLKGKVLLVVCILMVSVTGVYTTEFIWIKLQDDIAQAKALSLQTAKTLSYMPALQESFLENGDLREFTILVDQMQYELKPMIIIFQKRNGSIIASSDEQKKYNQLRYEDIKKALIFGSSYVIQTEESNNQVLKAVSPIMIDYGDFKKIEGAVTVLYEMDVIYEEVREQIKKILLNSFVILLICVAGSYYLANSIRRDTLNLEPAKIASLYRERSAILQSVKEGLVAIDDKDNITMINSSASQMLGIESNAEGRKLTDVITSPTLLDILLSHEKQSNIEIQYKEKTLIVNTQPVYENSKPIGIVATFRDRTEIKQMIDTLSEVKQYSDDLRAQAHEFSNKLYTILGLLQLDRKTEAIDFIKSEMNTNSVQGEVSLSKIRDEKVKAILLGKMAQASEKKIQFIIDPESSLEPLPKKIPMSSLIIVLGNLINNAFEAVKDQNEKVVRFFVTDIGNEVIFEVIDNGQGIREGVKQLIFTKGFSTKGENRGYGLGNVKEEVESLGGIIEFTSKKGHGTVFTVYLPK